LLAGCTPAEQPRGTAEGTVTFGGRPLTTGTISFTNGSTNAAYNSDLDGNGRFRFEVAAGYGLPPGEYRVAISPFTPPKPSIHYVNPDMTKREYPAIPQKYQQAETSGLSATVRGGANPDFLFEIP
jgi:hypothetical protein